MFFISSIPLKPEELNRSLSHPSAGALVTFEGWVRNHNEGHDVSALEYECYEKLAAKEGEKIVKEAIAKFGIIGAKSVHRVGKLEVGELAVWVGVTSKHRAEAFQAAQYIIDEIKLRVPIWKKEYYKSGDSGWVNCHRCSSHAGQSHS